MIEVTHIEKVEDGFMLRWNNPERLAEGAYVHLTSGWVADFYVHQFKPYGIQNGALNRLRYGFDADTLTVANAAELFVEAYQDAASTAAEQRNKRRRTSGPLQDFIGSGRAKNR